MSALFFARLLLLAAPTQAPQRFRSLHVADLVPLLAAGDSRVFLYDANVESTRLHVGIIPGARLLPTAHDYDLAREMPRDKASRLVFYCANVYCTASHQAAERALRAGYTDVSVM